MKEKDVAKNLIKYCPRFLIKPIADKYGYGTPDRCVKVRGTSRVQWWELKYLDGLPKRSCKVKLKTNQAKWLQKWRDDGGEAFLLVGIGKGKIAVFKDNFIDICKHGVKLKDFNLVEYNEVQEVMLNG